MRAATPVTSRVVEVDGIPMSALCAQVDEPRAVVVAVHGGAADARYFDLPGHPRASLLRLGAALGYTVLAPDRPGYGASAVAESEFLSPERRVDATYRTVDALLGPRSRGAGVFLMGHSAGCDLAVHWPHDFRALAGDVRVPVRITSAEHESVWRCDDAALREVAGLFQVAPRCEVNVQFDSGHNVGAGYGATAYHLGVLAFAEECVVDARPAQAPAANAEISAPKVERGA